MRMPRIIQKRVGPRLREREGGEEKRIPTCGILEVPVGSTIPLTVDGVRDRASGGWWGAWGPAG